MPCSVAATISIIALLGFVSSGGGTRCCLCQKHETVVDGKYQWQDAVDGIDAKDAVADLLR